MLKYKHFVKKIILGVICICIVFTISSCDKSGTTNTENRIATHAESSVSAKEFSFGDYNENNIIQSSSPLERVSYTLANWDTPNVVDNSIDVNSDGKTERIELGLDRPNGTLIRIEHNDALHNLLYKTSSFSPGVFDELGFVALGTTIELSFVDFNGDGHKDCFISTRKDNHIDVKIILHFEKEKIGVPFIEIGSLTSDENIWLDDTMNIWTVNNQGKGIQKYTYHDQSSIFEEEGKQSQSFISKEISTVIDREGNLIDEEYVYKMNIFNEEESLVKFITTNMWTWKDDPLMKLFFKDNKLFVGDSGSWREYAFKDINSDLNKLEIRFRVSQSSTEVDTEHSSEVKKENLEIILKLGKLSHCLEFYSYNHKTEEAQVEALQFLLKH